ncbi:hypothetical protein B0H14DRAFT_2603348 [Mycena olivaceomarginata]|nr:hypothetical protein B0H14DRAFT_2603348 [Mycena olivaceomarginata]
MPKLGKSKLFWLHIHHSQREWKSAALKTHLGRRRRTRRNEDFTGKSSLSSFPAALLTSLPDPLRSGRPSPRCTGATPVGGSSVFGWCVRLGVGEGRLGGVYTGSGSGGGAKSMELVWQRPGPIKDWCCNAAGCVGLGCGDGAVRHWIVCRGTLDMLAILNNNLANVPKEKLGLRPVFWRWQKTGKLDDTADLGGAEEPGTTHNWANKSCARQHLPMAVTKEAGCGALAILQKIPGSACETVDGARRKGTIICMRG